MTPKCQHVAATRVTGYDVDDINEGADVYLLTASRGDASNWRNVARKATLRLEPVCVYKLYEYVDDAVQTSSVERDDYDIGQLWRHTEVKWSNVHIHAMLVFSPYKSMVFLLN